ncbi:hypothetical protein J0910_14495 [Nocardiopsis sp. CNT-189]|uniref:hypothetical protein n=1 Tax=Nocardiopsis oceanisediminis TaxID=2816862 RepID=UPI003B2CC768
MPPSPRSREGIRLRPPDAGAGKIEYGAVVLLTAALVAAVFAVDVAGSTRSLYEEAFCRIGQGEDCAGPGNPSGDDLETRHLPPPPAPAEPICDPLCEPNPGWTPFVQWPDPRADHPEDAIAIKSIMAHDSADVDDVSHKTLFTWPWTVLESKEQDAYIWANGGSLKGLWTARRALLHFLDGSGDDFEVDADEIMEDVPEFREAVEKHREDIAREAVNRAKESGAKGTLTFPVSSEWNAFGYGPDGKYVYDDPDWINTLGSWNHSETGEVTVFPPDEPGGEWTYEMSTMTHVKKYYDWDRDKTGPAVGAGPIDSPFSERDLSEMHRTGLAQEFWAVGNTSPTHTEGTL